MISLADHIEEKLPRMDLPALVVRGSRDSHRAAVVAGRSRAAVATGQAHRHSGRTAYSQLQLTD